MSRLLRFFLLVSLRVIAVASLIFWATSQVRNCQMQIPVGSMAIEAGFYTDGCLFAVVRGQPKEFFMVLFEPTYWNAKDDVGPSIRPIPGLPIWVHADSHHLRLASAYWLILLTAVVLYGAVEYLGRRRRKGLAGLAAVSARATRNARRNAESRRASPE